jgi:hypothetical protein
MMMGATRVCWRCGGLAGGVHGEEWSLAGFQESRGGEVLLSLSCLCRTRFDLLRVEAKTAGGRCSRLGMRHRDMTH